MSPLSRRIVDQIVADLRDRNILRQAWSNMDYATRDAIRAAWGKIVDEETGEDE